MYQLGSIVFFLTSPAATCTIVAAAPSDSFIIDLHYVKHYSEPS